MCNNSKINQITNFPNPIHVMHNPGWFKVSCELWGTCHVLGECYLLSLHTSSISIYTQQQFHSVTVYPVVITFVLCCVGDGNCVLKMLFSYECTGSVVLSASSPAPKHQNWLHTGFFLETLGIFKDRNHWIQLKPIIMLYMYFVIVLHTLFLRRGRGKIPEPRPRMNPVLLVLESLVTFSREWCHWCYNGSNCAWAYLGARNSKKSRTPSNMPHVPQWCGLTVVYCV